MNNMTLEALEKRIQTIEDIQAIKDLKALYANICDDCYNPERMGQVFTEDAVWDGGEDFGRYEGLPAIRSFFQNVAKDIDFAVHYFVQPKIEMADDGVSAKATWYLWQAFTMKGQGLWLSALEHDTYIKKDGRWWQNGMVLETFFLTPYEEGWHKVKILK